ncbi:MAG: cytochrome c oxidase accessory protein CcoG [Alphaproteobacteria bacterium]
MTEATDKHDEILSRAEQKKTPLYADRVKVFPKAVSGRWRQIKWAALILLLTVYYVTPWLRWDRGPGVPDQAVLIDLGNRRAYYFFIEIWPQEVYYLTGILILAAVGLFLATSLFGRIWCGYACPQTAWTDLFMWVERLVEGDRSARIRLDKSPMSGAKLVKRAVKHGIWLLIALLTGGAWMMYFQDAPTFVAEFFTGQSSFTVYFFVGLFTATTYLLAGWAREQVCTYMCPWPRIQSALLDEESLVVTYRDWRGEPRGPHKKGQSWDGRGDCIDCKQCVAACPMGIDIRDGIQLECIGCGLCIDACDEIMDRVERPRGLIAFDTEKRMQAKHADPSCAGPRPRPVRPRTIVYVVVLAIVAAIMAVGLSGRSSEDMTVLHDRAPLFVTLSDGSVRNGYEIKVLNKTHEPRTYTLTVTGLADPRFQVVGMDGVMSAPVTLTAPADSVAEFQVYVSVAPDSIDGDTVPVTFVLTESETGETTSIDDVFRGP